MTLLGALFVLAAVVAFLWRPSFVVYVLAASAAFPASAAVVVAGNALTPFALLGLLAAVTLLFDRRRIRAGRGRSMLLVFVLWSLVVTIAGPMLFAGMAVLSPRDGIDNAVVAPARLAFSVSSLAQAVYLLVGALVVLFLARSGARSTVAAVPLAIGTGLSALSAVFSMAGIAWPNEFFDTNPNVLYSDTSDGGSSRLRGIFNEPSELAGFSLAAAAFFAVAAARSRGRGRVLYAGFGALAVVNLGLSSSGTAAVGVVVFAAFAALAIFVHLIRSNGRSVPYVLFAVIVGAAAAVAFGAQTIGWIDQIVNGKVGSDSYLTRTASDLFSLRLAAETGGIGVGLGVNRPSSFLTMLISGVGVIGLVAFAAFAFSVARGALATPAAQPVFWSLVALLIAKSVSLPDLSTPILWLLLGVCASASWTTQTVRPVDAERGHLEPLNH